MIILIFYIIYITGKYDYEMLKEKCQILDSYLTHKDDKDIVSIELFNDIFQRSFSVQITDRL